MDRTVVALFDDVNTAQRALEEMLSKGFDRNDISVVRADQKTGAGAKEAADAIEPSGTATGAGIGAALGGIAGLVIGLGALAIPGVGPIVAAGPLAATLAGAGIGAATGGIIGALADAGIPEQDAGYYAEGIRRGGTLLTVRTDENRVSQATEILNRFAPVNVNERANEWRAAGWTGYDKDAGTYTPGATGGQYSAGGGMDVTGSRYASSSISSTGQYAGMSPRSSSGRFEDFDADFRTDWETRYRNTGFNYQRYQPAYRYGWEAGSRYQGRDWNDVAPNLRTDWQRNHPNDAWEDFKDSVRTGWERFKQGASSAADDVRQGAHEMGRNTERTFDRTTNNMSRTFDTYDPDFRNDWQRSYSTRGYGYERYQPAYRYGYNVASESRYRGHRWDEIEPDLRRDWEMEHPNDRWEDFKDAVRHAWQRVRSDVKDAVD